MCPQPFFLNNQSNFSFPNPHPPALAIVLFPLPENSQSMVSFRLGSQGACPVGRANRQSKRMGASSAPQGAAGAPCQRPPSGSTEGTNYAPLWPGVFLSPQPPHQPGIDIWLRESERHSIVRRDRRPPFHPGQQLRLRASVAPVASSFRVRTLGQDIGHVIRAVRLKSSAKLARGRVALLALAKSWGDKWHVPNRPPCDLCRCTHLCRRGDNNAR